MSQIPSLNFPTPEGTDSPSILNTRLSAQPQYPPTSSSPSAQARAPEPYEPIGREDLSKYKLPPIVETAVVGWKDTLIATGVITGLATTLEMTFLQMLSNQGAPPNTDLVKGFIYSSIILNLTAGLMSVLSLIMLSNLPSRARWEAANTAGSLPYRFMRAPQEIELEYLIAVREEDMLYAFGISPIWRMAKITVVVTFFIGSVCTLMGLMTWVWMIESTGIATVATIVFSLCALIIGFVLLHLLFSR